MLIWSLIGILLDISDGTPHILCRASNRNSDCKAEQDCFGAPGTEWNDFSQNWAWDVSWKNHQQKQKYNNGAKTISLQTLFGRLNK
jgi:hypothetical protein